MLDFDRFKVLTFDCYGTLIDWETGILRAIKPVLVKHGVGAGDSKILETYAEAEARQESDDFIRYELVLRVVMASISLRLGFDGTLEELDCISRSIKNWEPFADTIDSLKKLKTRYKLAVVSNIDENLFEATAKRLEVPLDWVITAQQAQAYKPSARIFKLALEMIGHPVDEILHVAQSVYHDIVPARALGLSTVWVDRRKGRPGSGATLSAEGRPDVEVPDLAGLVKAAGLA